MQSRRPKKDMVHLEKQGTFSERTQNHMVWYYRHTGPEPDEPELRPDAVGPFFAETTEGRYGGSTSRSSEEDQSLPVLAWERFWFTDQTGSPARLRIRLSGCPPRPVSGHMLFTAPEW